MLADPDWQSDAAVIESVLAIVVSEKSFLQLLKVSAIVCMFPVHEGLKTVFPELLRLGVGASPPSIEQKLVTEFVTCPVALQVELKVIIYG